MSQLNVALLAQPGFSTLGIPPHTESEDDSSTFGLCALWSSLVHSMKHPGILRTEIECVVSAMLEEAAINLSLFLFIVVRLAKMEDYMEKATQ